MNQPRDIMRSLRNVRTVLVVLALAGISAAGCSDETGAGGSSSNGSTSSSGGAAPDDPDAEVDAQTDDATCSGPAFELERSPASVLFVIDRSGSMNCNPPPTTTTIACEQTPTSADPNLPTKWTMTRDALKSAFAKMSAETSVGLAYFNVDNTCGVDADPAVAVKPCDGQQVASLSTSLEGVTPEGLTPIVGAVTLAYGHLDAGTFAGRKLVVLLTDGSETCGAGQVDHFLSTTVPAATAMGIRTMVLGIPGSENARSFLSQMAYAGATARTATCVHGNAVATVGDCHFDLTAANPDPAVQLGAALDAVIEETLACEYAVPKPDSGVIDVANVAVELTATKLPRVNDASSCTGDGWYVGDLGGTKVIRLCSSSCAALRTNPAARVVVRQGCAG